MSLNLVTFSKVLFSKILILSAQATYLAILATIVSLVCTILCINMALVKLTLLQRIHFDKVYLDSAH